MTDTPQYMFEGRGLTVKVKNNDVMAAYRKLKKAIKADGLLQKLQDKEAFVSKGQKHRLKMKAAKVRWRKKQSEMQELRGW